MTPCTLISRMTVPPSDEGPAHKNKIGPRPAYLLGRTQALALTRNMLAAGPAADRHQRLEVAPTPNSATGLSRTR